MSGILGNVAYGEVLEVGKRNAGGQVIEIAGTADDLRAAAKMLYRRVAVLDVEALEALTSAAGKGAPPEITPTKARLESRLEEVLDDIDSIHYSLTNAGIPGSREVDEDTRQALLLEDRIELALAERADLQAEVERLKKEKEQLDRFGYELKEAVHQIAETNGMGPHGWTVSAVVESVKDLAAQRARRDKIAGYSFFRLNEVALALGMRGEWTDGMVLEAARKLTAQRDEFRELLDAASTHLTTIGQAMGLDPGDVCTSTGIAKPVKALREERDRLQDAATKASAELRHAYRYRESIDPRLIARAIEVLERAVTNPPAKGEASR